MEFSGVDERQRVWPQSCSDAHCLETSKALNPDIGAHEYGTTAKGEMEWMQNQRLRMDLLPVDFLRRIR